MNTRRFGRTGIEISELTLGAGFVGGLLIHAPDDDKRACIAARLESGVNWSDTAPAYGDGESDRTVHPRCPWGEGASVPEPHLGMNVPHGPPQGPFRIGLDQRLLTGDRSSRRSPGPPARAGGRARKRSRRRLKRARPRTRPRCGCPC